MHVHITKLSNGIINDPLTNMQHSLTKLTAIDEDRTVSSYLRKNRRTGPEL